MGARPPPPVWKSRNDGLESTADILARVRRRINAAKVNSGKTWEEMFKLFDRNNSGTLDWSELRLGMRSILRIPTQTVCDYELKLLFNEMDQNGNSAIDVAELFEYVQHGHRRPEDENARYAQRIKRVQKNLQLAFSRVSSNEADVRRLFKKLDVDGSNRLSPYEFTVFVRMNLNLNRWDIMNADLQEFYNFLDKDRDGVDVHELLWYLRRKDKDNDSLGAQRFYTPPDVPKATKKKTFRKQLEESISLRHSNSMPALRLTPPFNSLGRERKAATRAALSMSSIF